MGQVIEDHVRKRVVEPTKRSERVEGGEELIEANRSYLKRASEMGPSLAREVQRRPKEARLCLEVFRT